MNNGLAVSRTLEPHRHTGDALRATEIGGQGVSTPARCSHGVARQRALFAGLSLLTMFAVGCAGLHPIEGISADCLPPELNQAYRSSQQTIDLSLLGQDGTTEYRVDNGDILAVYIQGVLGGGAANEAPPVMLQPDSRRPSSTGYPVQVRDNGTLSLPLVKPINVRGLTLNEVEDLIRKTYTEDNKILQPNREHILVSLQQPRLYRILVMRDEQVSLRHNSQTTFGYNTTEPAKRGQIVELPARENDVLHALAVSGGMPNLDAEDAVYIIRHHKDEPKMQNPPPAPGASPQALKEQLQLQSKRAKQQATAQLAAAMSKKDSKSKTGIQLVSNDEPATRRPATTDEWWRTNEPTLRNRVEEFWKVPAQLSKSNKNRAVKEPWWEEKTANKAKSEDEIQNMSGEDVADATDVSWAEPQPVPAPGVDVQATTVDQPTVGPITCQADDSTILNPKIVRIPLRLIPGETPMFTPEDVVLRDGDVVFIESREDEFFYTSGLLGGGQYALPRDYDLDLLGAMSIVQAQVNSSHHNSTKSVGGNSTLNQDVSVGASKVIIRRKTADHLVMNIEVDLHDAVRSPENKVFIQPGDYVILQYTKPEAVAAWTERFVLEPFLSAVSFGALSRN